MNAAAVRRSGRTAAHRAGILTPVLGMLLTAAGCASRHVAVATDPVAAVRDAAAASAGIHTAMVATDATMAVGDVRQEFRGLGQFDFDRQIGAITVTMAQNAAPLDEVITPSTLYLRSAGSNATWRWISAARLPDGDLISAGYTSPLFDFALLRGVGGAGGTAHYVGQDSVRGAAVVHYSGTLDLAASAEAATEPVRTSLLAAARSFSQKSVPFDVYLDDQGRARRVIAHYAFAAAAPQHGQAEITATTDLYEIDRPVTVSTPTGAAPVDVPTTNASPSAKATPKAKSTRR